MKRAPGSLAFGSDEHKPFARGHIKFLCSIILHLNLEKKEIEFCDIIMFVHLNGPLAFVTLELL